MNGIISPLFSFFVNRSLLPPVTDWLSDWRCAELPSSMKDFSNFFCSNYGVSVAKVKVILSVNIVE